MPRERRSGGGIDRLPSGRYRVRIVTPDGRRLSLGTHTTKRAAEAGPVFITDRGRPAHVLLSARAYQALAGPRQSLADVLALPGGAEIDFDPPRSRTLHRPAHLG